MNTANLHGKFAVVTGGAQGLGRQVAAELIRQGARVAIVGRTESTLKQAADELGHATLAIVADIADPHAVRRAFQAVDEAFGGLDILINNAAIYRAFDFDQASDNELSETFAINVLGASYCMRAAIALLRRRGGGDIVNVSSESVRAPFPLLSIYAASKAALEMLSTALRNELRADNIRVGILRSGHMNGDNASVQGWPEGRLERFVQAMETSGHLQAIGAGMEPATVARTLVASLLLPREASIDLLEVRPA